jgi:hypothetical protein
LTNEAVRKLVATRTDAEVLAVSWIGETNFDIYINPRWSDERKQEAQRKNARKWLERPHMGHVYLRRAKGQGLSLKFLLTQYSWNTWHKMTPRAQWLRELTSKCDRPKSWSSKLSWDGLFRERCDRIFQQAKNFLENPTEDTCNADHFGGSMDNPHPSLERIDCGDTRQIYYRRKPAAK